MIGIAGYVKMSDRDQALIGILERLGGEMAEQDKKLGELLKQNEELTKAIASTERNLRSKQIDAEKAQDKLFDSFHHYRSDMLSLVNEQDRINHNMGELQTLVKNAMYTLDAATLKVSDIDERLSILEKTTQNHFEHALKQPGFYQSALDESNRKFTKLYADTEKHLGELSRETDRHLDKFQHDTMRRLLLLDGIINSLQTILQRTEPQEKKTPWISVQFSKITYFFRHKVPGMLRN